MRLFVLLLAIALLPLCSSAQHKSSTATISISVKIHPVSDQGKINLYPNPAKTYVNIYAEWGSPQPFTVSVIDSKGTVLNEWKEGPVLSYQKALTVTELPAGKYYIKVKSKKAEMTQQFTVDH